jgi:hypothetical protein
VTRTGETIDQGREAARGGFDPARDEPPTRQPPVRSWFYRSSANSESAAAEAAVAEPFADDEGIEILSVNDEPPFRDPPELPSASKASQFAPLGASPSVGQAVPDGYFGGDSLGSDVAVEEDAVEASPVEASPVEEDEDDLDAPAVRYRPFRHGLTYEEEEIEEETRWADARRSSEGGSPERALRPKTWPFRAGERIASGWEWCLGAASMLATLAALSTIPIVQFVSLGYLLEVVGRMVRTQKFSSGFIGIRTFARIGSVVFGTWAILIPLRFLADVRHSAYLIDPESRGSRMLAVALLVCTVLGVANIVMAWAAGGRLRHFFWPLFAPLFLAIWTVRGLLRLILSPALPRQGGTGWFAKFADDLTHYHPLTTWFPPAVLLAGIVRGRPYAEARNTVWDFVVSLRLPYYFWLGLRGFVGTILWLAFPVILLIGGARLPEGAGVLSALAGGFLFGLVMVYLPFLQAQFAAENRFRAMFDVFAVRRAFNRAPFVFWLGIFVTLALALPLYLLKIEMPPSEFGWLEALFFVALMYPARLLTGWAMTRGTKCEQPRFFLFRWISRMALVPIAAIYALFVFLTQYFCWYGSWSLFEQHAVLVPTPFLSF